MPFINFKFQISNFKLSFEGFTLVELLVSIALVSLVTAVAIPNFRQLSKDQDINNTAGQLINILRRAQSSAASRIRCPINDEISTNWSVELTNNNYILKSQCNTPANNPVVYTSPYAQTPTSNTTFLATNNTCNPATQTVTVFFTAVQTTYQCAGGSILPLTSNLVLTIDPSGSSKTVTIEPGGTIK